MFNGGQHPASIFSPICTLNHELSSEPSFPAPQLYLLRHTLNDEYKTALQNYHYTITIFSVSQDKTAMFTNYVVICHTYWIINVNVLFVSSNIKLYEAFNCYQY